VRTVRGPVEARSSPSGYGNVPVLVSWAVRQKLPWVKGKATSRFV
jgi:hypothetical protein